MDQSTREKHLRQINEQGYTIVERVLDRETVAALRDDIHRLEQDLRISEGTNEFEGRRTLRTHNLLAHGRPYERLATHRDILPLVDLVLGPGCLLSMIGSINIGPGETAQPIHADDQIIPFAKPHRAIVCNTMWAISDFTAVNGATRLVPGSHRKDHSPRYGTDYESVSAEMGKGSVLIWHGSLWHGGGANQSDASRIGISVIYCAGYLRQEENQQLGIPPRKVLGFEPRLQELVGYGVYMGVLGHVDRAAPAELLRARPDRTDAGTAPRDAATIAAWRGMERP